MNEASVYQVLRGHLATLRLAAAAEALPGVLEAARSEGLGHTAMLERLLAIEVTVTEAAAALFQVVAHRYGRGSIAVTTNLGIPSKGRIFDDPTVAAAMLDRLLHRSVVFNIDGDSYRMRAHRARAEQVPKGVVVRSGGYTREVPPGGLSLVDFR